MAEPIFYFFISPNGMEGDRQKFTLNFEINDNHPDSLDSATETDRIKWKKAVGNFPLRITEVIKKYDNIVVIATDLPTICSQPEAAQDVRVKLWQVITGESQITGSANGIMGATQIKGKGKDLKIPAIPNYDIPLSQIKGNSAPETLIDAGRSPLFMTDRGQLSVGKFEEHLSDFVSSNGSSKGLDEGISRQAEMFLQANRNRFEAIKSNNSDLFLKTASVLTN